MSDHKNSIAFGKKHFITIRINSSRANAADAEIQGKKKIYYGDNEIPRKFKLFTSRNFWSNQTRSKKKGGFICMLLETLGALLSGKFLSGKGTIHAR